MSSEAAWDNLRKPFPKEVMGLLPRVSCYACSQASKGARSALDKHCDRHKMSKCKECGAYISEAHIHLDFVGHAAITDRLNSAVGPDGWVLEPMGVDEHGNPVVKNGELWCWLYVAGVRKMCVGDGASSAKELIGDALRNGAMRFGVALDLWTKDELESTLEDPSLKNHKPTHSPSSEPPSSEPLATDEDVKHLRDAAKGLTIAQLKLAFTSCGIPVPSPFKPADAFTTVPRVKAGELALQLGSVER